MTGPSIAVVGAGLIGCLVAREVSARHPDASVIVLDRDCVGAGASRRSAGLFLPRGATPRTRRMSAYSQAYYAALKAHWPRLPIRPVGATVITDGTAADAAEGLSAAGYLADVAAPARTGPPGPGIRLAAGSQAWRIGGCHHADVYGVTQCIAAELRTRARPGDPAASELRAPVRFAESVAVTGLSPGRGSVTVRVSTGERIVADRVVLAPGPWLSGPAWGDLLAPAGLRVKKIVAMHLEQRPDPADDAVIFESDDAFLLPLPGRGHWLFSYTCQEWDVDPDALTGGLSAADVAAARDCLRRYSPALAAACGAGRVFCDAYSPSREPLVRALDDAGRVVFAGAANGSGYRLGPAIGAAAADLLDLTLSEGATGDHQYV